MSPSSNCAYSIPYRLARLIPQIFQKLVQDKSIAIILVIIKAKCSVDSPMWVVCARDPLLRKRPKKDRSPANFKGGIHAKADISALDCN